MSSNEPKYNDNVLTKWQYRTIQFLLYLGMITALDDAVGVITEGLKALGLMDNTIIVFTSDVCIN